MTVLNLPQDGETTSNLVAIVGIAGTLLGSVITGILALIGQKQQISHENQTRFHERRLNAYADFNAACNRVAAAAQLRVALPQDSVDAVLLSFETVRLVASAPVNLAARRVHAVIHAVLTNPAGPTPHELGFSKEVAIFCTAVRQEMGVQPRASENLGARILQRLRLPRQ